MKEKLAALKGWYSLEDEHPHLLGGRCPLCGTWYFPLDTEFCRNPDCDSAEIVETPLSNRGTLWSFSTQYYQPPPPYIVNDDFEPYTVGAVELSKEKIIILGQFARGIKAADLTIGTPVKLILEPLFSDEEGEHLIWKWQPEKTR